jgi:glycerophosphoryl diester phosphodiesterase
MSFRSFFYLFTMLLPLLASCNSESGKEETTKEANTMMIPSDFDWQGHRGARGLMPENTIPAFLEALKYPIKTLELDVVISADSQVVISHEPWFSAEICSRADGEAFPEEKAEPRIFQMTLAEIATYDCGTKPHPRFPEQKKMKVSKPSLREMVSAVERYCEVNQREKPLYNIELKARPEWDDELTPPPARFSRLVLDELAELQITERTTIQCFDVRILKEMHLRNPELSLALLVDESEDGIEKMEGLGFIPQIYSPFFLTLNKKKVKSLHEKGVKVIPWTVNDIETMKALIALGVDGIITDYPNLIVEAGKD